MKMIKQLSAIALVVALGACSSDSGSEPETTGGDTTGDDTTGGTTSGGDTGGPVTPSGNISGVWFGDNNFGNGIMIVDANQNVRALTANVSNYESVFGPASAPLERFAHRDSENPAFADSFTLSGEPFSKLTSNAADDTVVYNLVVENDGQQITNTVAASAFSMTFADENALPNLSLAQAAGTWVTTTSFCPVDCNLTLTINITEAGVLSGTTVFNNFDPLDIEDGVVSVDAGATQYLNVSFNWLGTARNGVLYRDRNDTNRLIINTVGPHEDTGESRSFTGSLIRQ